MIKLSKRITIGLLSGAVFLAGSYALMQQTQAAQHQPPELCQHMVAGQQCPDGPQCQLKLTPEEKQAFLEECKERMAQHREQVVADLSEKCQMTRDDFMFFVNNGYHCRDIYMAKLLSDESGKSVQSMLDMKKINNRWHDVAAELQVDMVKIMDRIADMEGAPGMQAGFYPGAPGGPCGPGMQGKHHGGHGPHGGHPGPWPDKPTPLPEK